MPADSTPSRAGCRLDMSATRISDESNHTVAQNPRRGIYLDVETQFTHPFARTARRTMSRVARHTARTLRDPVGHSAVRIVTPRRTIFEAAPVIRPLARPRSRLRHHPRRYFPPFARKHPNVSMMPRGAVEHHVRPSRFLFSDVARCLRWNDRKMVKFRDILRTPPPTPWKLLTISFRDFPSTRSGLVNSDRVISRVSVLHVIMNLSVFSLPSSHDRFLSREKTGGRFYCYDAESQRRPTRWKSLAIDLVAATGHRNLSRQ